MYRIIFPVVISLAAGLQAQAVQFTHADTLRGSDGPARSWWDVTFYDLHVVFLAVRHRVRPPLRT